MGGAATAGDIAYHCDLADVVGLLCLRAARRGGASRIVSSVTVYNELLARRPALVARLYEPFRLESRGEEGARGPAWVPIPPVSLRGWPAPHLLSQRLFPLRGAASGRPPVHRRLDMQFEPGDVQLISNHAVLHARTAYEDEPGPGRRRHLLRLWRSLE